MNTKFFSGLAVVFAAVTTLQLHAQTGNYAVTGRGPDWKVMQKTAVENGVTNVHRYTELATGMNYTNATGQLVESREQIAILPTGGASATQGRHKVYFPGDIGAGVLEVVTPDGKHLYSRPLGVTYDDGSNTVFIATLTNAVGYLTSSNQVTYRNCFNGIKADLVCTWRRSGFECDLVFRQQPPTPSDYGLDAGWSTLQMVTEFFNTQDPQQIPGRDDEWFGLQDSTLKFGKLTMKQGKAFAFNGTNSHSQAGAVPVYKRWVKFDGRKFLIEEVPVIDLAEDLNALPLTAQIEKPESGKLKFASRAPAFPASHEIKADTNQILLAAADLAQEPGVVLDYVTVNSGQTDFTFQADTTYYVVGNVYFDGATVFEGGAVIKGVGDDHGGQTCISVSGPIYCPGDAAKPAIFTSINDDSVGEILPESNGSPSLNGTFNYLAFDSGTISNVLLKNMRFYYGGVSATLPLEIWNGQFVNIGCAISAGSDLCLHNVLFHRNAEDDCVDAAVWFTQGSLVAENVTANHVVFADWQGGYGPATFTLVNCLMTEQSRYSSGNEYNINYFYDPPVVYATNFVWVQEPQTPVYETAGNDHFYLATTSPYRNAGTTAIDPDLLAELQTLTTYAPQDGGMPDTNAPDLGYHYPVNEDSDHDGLPDWWEWHWFGNYSLSGTNLDAGGYTLLSIYQDYANGIATNDPNVIEFSIGADNDYVNTTTVSVQLDITAGTPSYYAVFVNSTNTTNWLNFAGTNLTVPLMATTDGVYTVTIGLKGCAAEATETWRNYAFYLDRVAPVLTITNPVLSSATATVIKPYLQLQGFADEPLASLSYDLSNETGLFTNENALVTDQWFDTNRFDFTTNFFQAYDVPLATNDNWITLRVTDRAGNTTTTNFTVVLDYSGATNPAIQLTWPQNDLKLVGDDFTLRGWTEDPASSVTARIASTNATNTISGMVERTGVLWAEHLPLNEGTNWVTLAVTNAAGLGSETNFYVIKSDMTFALTSIEGNLWAPTVSVGGVISDPVAPVWVNGIEGTNNGDGTWSAANVPVSKSGVASFDFSTLPPGAPDPAGSTNVEKEPYWGIVEHHANLKIIVTAYDQPLSYWLKSKDVRQKDYTTVWSTNYQGNPIDLLNGSVVDTSELTDNINGMNGWTNIRYDWTYWGGWCVWSNSIGQSDSGPFYPGQPNDRNGEITGIPERHPVEHYYADKVHYYWLWHNYGGWTTEDEIILVKAKTQVKLFTGGKAGVARQNLFAIDCWAEEYRQTGSVDVPDILSSRTVKKTELEVCGKQVGADGKLWVALPDNSEQDITVTAKGKKHYDAWAEPQKYKLVISANGVELDPDEVVSGATHWISEKIDLKQTFLPGLSESPVVFTNLWTLSGDYVNDHIQPYTTGSVDYFVNADKLTNSDTYAWWWRASTDGTQINVSLTDGITFANGQSVLLDASGLLKVVKPPMTITASNPGDVWGHDDFLGLGGYQIGGAAYFGVIFDCNFNGSFLSQNCIHFLRTAVLHREQMATTGTNYITDSTGLDKEFPAGIIHENDSPSVRGTAIDSAGHITASGCTPISANDSFVEYLMFQYGSPGAIPVPLKSVDWNWGGTASANNNWQPSSPQRPNFVYHQDPGFPQWTNSTHLYWTSHQP